MGDVITMRGGTTVEVTNTDAEGRLVMGDALVLAAEEPTDAIVDIATLTGAGLRALGPEVPGSSATTRAGGPDHGGRRRHRRAGVELPLARRYRKELDSDVADMNNLGGAHAGAITAALFLVESSATTRGRTSTSPAPPRPTATRAGAAGCTGFGARLLVELGRLRGPGHRLTADDPVLDAPAAAPAGADRTARPAHARHHRARRQQGAAPGHHLPRPVRPGDRPVGRAGRVRRQRHLRRRRSTADRRRGRTSADRSCWTEPVLDTAEPTGRLRDDVEIVRRPLESLLSTDGIRFLFSSFVNNFAGFTVVAVVFVAMIGVGVAEEAGLMGALIRKLVKVAPPPRSPSSSCSSAACRAWPPTPATSSSSPSAPPRS